MGTGLGDYDDSSMQLAGVGRGLGERNIRSPGCDHTYRANNRMEDAMIVRCSTSVGRMTIAGGRSMHNDA